jgi:hypothetical protein
MILKNSDPEKFYKYRSMQPGAAKYVLQTIVSNEIYFASPNSFNDIFDCKPVVTFDCTDEQFIEQYIALARKHGSFFSQEKLLHDAREAIGDPYRDLRITSAAIRFQQELALSLHKTGVYCVSERNDDILMWSHYADNHRGVCLEFNGGAAEMIDAQRVIYAEDRPAIDQFRDTTVQEKMEKALLTKSSHWSYEKEWRIVHHVKGVGKVKLESNTLTGLIFGAATSKQTKDDIMLTLANNAISLPLFQAVPDDREFRITILPVT